MDTRRDRGGADLTTPELSIVIPAYNEGDNILAVLSAIIEAVPADPLEILVVYDFDEDTTVPAVLGLQERHPQVHLCRNTFGRGALNAIRSGFAVARAPYVVVTMADGSDDPRSIDLMVRTARDLDADLVAASRYMRGGRQVGGPPFKRLLSRTAGLSLHLVGGIPIHDPTNNFKLYSRRLLDAVTIESTAGFELALELTTKAHRIGMKMAELPTTWRDRTAGESRFRLRQWLPHYFRWYRYGVMTRFARGT